MKDLIQVQLKCVECVHDKGFVHRDIQPSNCAFGLDGNESKLYLLDFGFAEKFIDEQGRHISEEADYFTGHVCFASKNVTCKMTSNSALL